MGQPDKRKAARDSRFLLGKKCEFHGINLLWGQLVHSENYNYLNPTQLLDLSCSFVQFLFGLWIYLWQYNTFKFFELLRFTELRWYSIQFSKEVIQRRIQNPVEHLRWSFLRKQLTAIIRQPFLEKSSILDFRLGSKYASVIARNMLVILTIKQRAHFTQLSWSIFMFCILWRKEQPPLVVS